MTLTASEEEFYRLLNHARESCGGAWSHGATIPSICTEINIAFEYFNSHPQIRHRTSFRHLLNEALDTLKYNPSMKGRIEADKLLCTILNTLNQERYRMQKTEGT